MKGKRITAILFAIASCLSIAGQSAKQWSLEECIGYAVKHNIDIQQRKIQKDNAEIDLNTAKMSRLPDLNAGGGSGFNFGRSNANERGIYEQQRVLNAGFSVSSSTPLFTGFRIPNQIDKNELDLEASIQNLEKAKEDLSIQIASLYLQVLFNKEIVKVSEEQLSLSQTQVKRTEHLFEAGKVPVSQLFDIKAQVAKDEVTVTESKNNLELSLLDLTQSLELERSVTFDIEAPDPDEIMDGALKSLLPPGTIYDNAVLVKPVIKEQEYKLESSKTNLKIAESDYMPKLDLNLQYSNSYFYNYDMPAELVNESFSSQMKNNGGEMIGISLNIPIFNRFQVKNQVKAARLGILDQQLALENVKKTLYKEIQTAYLNASSSQEKYNSSTKSVEASQESFKYAKERYEIGKSSVFEFNEAKTKLIQSLSEQIQAKYDYIFRTKILDFYNGVPIVL